MPSEFSRRRRGESAIQLSYGRKLSYTLFAQICDAFDHLPSTKARDSLMWQRLPAFIREWPILIVGILLIVPLLYFSSYDASSLKSTASAPSLSRNGESAGRPTAADAQAPSAEQSLRPAPPPAKTAPNSSQAPAKAPDMSHDRMASRPMLPPKAPGDPERAEGPELRDKSR